MNEEMTLENINQLESIINNYISTHDDDEKVTSLIMYKVLLFTLNGIKYDEKTLHDKCWEYYEENKDTLLKSVP